MADETAERGPGAVRAIASVAAIGGALLYLSNPGVPTLEWIPDGAPLMGNLDELCATLVLVWGVVGLFRKRGR